VRELTNRLLAARFDAASQADVTEATGDRARDRAASAASWCAPAASGAI
jgi:hypothetical protein